MLDDRDLEEIRQIVREELDTAPAVELTEEGKAALEGRAAMGDYQPGERLTEYVDGLVSRFLNVLTNDLRPNLPVLEQAWEHYCQMYENFDNEPQITDAEEANALTLALLNARQQGGINTGTRPVLAFQDMVIALYGLATAAPRVRNADGTARPMQAGDMFWKKEDPRPGGSGQWSTPEGGK